MSEDRIYQAVLRLERVVRQRAVVLLLAVLINQVLLAGSAVWDWQRTQQRRVSVDEILGGLRITAMTNQRMISILRAETDLQERRYRVLRAQLDHVQALARMR